MRELCTEFKKAYCMRVEWKEKLRIKGLYNSEIAKFKHFLPFHFISCV